MQREMRLIFVGGYEGTSNEPYADVQRLLNFASVKVHTLTPGIPVRLLVRELQWTLHEELRGAGPFGVVAHSFGAVVLRLALENRALASRLRRLGARVVLSNAVLSSRDPLGRLPCPLRRVVARRARLWTSLAAALARLVPQLSVPCTPLLGFDAGDRSCNLFQAADLTRAAATLEDGDSYIHWDNVLQGVRLNGLRYADDALTPMDVATWTAMRGTGELVTLPIGGHEPMRGKSGGKWAAGVRALLGPAAAARIR
jgi:hypothetical protein